jgi:hypothetical protein
VTAPSLISRDDAVVKAALLRAFADLLDPLLAAARSGFLTPREAERRTWAVLVELGAQLLLALLAATCRRATERVVVELGLDRLDVRLRMDADYWASLRTTLGPISFPWFAFRWLGHTHVPARELFPLYAQVRSSEVLLEWESSLAADHPFRKAEDALRFFTHGAARIEDTTIERHAVLAGEAIAPEWFYRRPADIRKILQERAVLEARTGRPIVQLSTDAHALRMFEGETWATAPKMVNGLRLWCKDRATGETIHLGGEFTTGDSAAVVRRLHELDRDGILPFDGNYGGGVRARICIVTDGPEWIADKVVPLYLGALASLDPYHVVEQVSDAARAAFPAATARQVIGSARKALGIRDRRGRTHYRKGPRRRLHRVRRAGLTGTGRRLLTEVLEPLEPAVRRGKKRYRRLLAFVRRNLYRLDYAELRRRGAQIGSGAMESLHRFGSQIRMKRAGCRWTARVAQAILNLRMLTLSGRWDEYWAQPGLAARVAAGGAA